MRWLLLLLTACSDYEIKATPDVPEPEDTASVETGDSEPPPDCRSLVAPDAPVPSRDETCLAEPATGSFDPVVEWTTEGTITFSEGTSYTHPYVMPAIGNLTDDNGDGAIDERDMPDIAYSAYSSTESFGYLHVVSGDGSGEVLNIGPIEVDGQTYQITRWAGIALGDLEGDGLPEIATIVQTTPSGSSYPAVFDNLGNLKWLYTGTATSQYSYPSIADLDEDGDAEVVVGHIILDTDGSELGVGTGGTATPDSYPWPSWGSISVPVDFDGDGLMEIASGNTVYDMHGNTLATSGLHDGFCAVGDMDGDGQPEIVTTVHSLGEVYVWEFDGTVLWSASTSAYGGGPPTIADFDGDGEPEIGVAGKYYYTVMDTDGSVLWNADTTDESSSATGSSVFDFDADGAAEVVFADEVALYVFDGATGTVVFRADDHVHGTAWEYPVIADVDRDDQAEIILGSTNSSSPGWNGITVIGDASESWAPARAVWNQHAYSITNINSDLSVPQVQVENWSTWNNFRAGGTELGPLHWLSDLAPVDDAICTDTCSLDEVTFYLTLENGGLLDSAAFSVQFIGVVGGTETTVYDEIVTALPSGRGAVLGPFVLSRAEWGSGLLIARVDALFEVTECDEDNNELSLGPWPCE